MLINKDHDHAHPVKVVFQHEGTSQSSFEGRVTLVTFGSAQYQWHSAGREGYADPGLPPAKSTVTGGQNTVYNLPPASLTVLRGKIKAR